MANQPNDVFTDGHLFTSWGISFDAVILHLKCTFQVYLHPQFNALTVTHMHTHVDTHMKAQNPSSECPPLTGSGNSLCYI